MESIEREPEVWKDIPGFEGVYQVSSWGNVRRLLNIKQRKTRSGYPSIKLQFGKKTLDRPIHILMADIFLQKEDYHEVVNHKDGNINNNKIENLEWVNQRENVTHSYRYKAKLSKYTGVRIRRYNVKDKVYVYINSEITVNGKKINLGNFKTEIEAHEAYINALKLHGLKNKYANGNQSL
jgi:hypothetical protein